MSRYVKFFFALITVPIVWGTLRAFTNVISIFNPLSTDHKLFIAGLVSYPVFQIIFSDPMRTYVFGHELTHALASLLMGGSFKNLKVSKKGGSVATSKSNFFICLAPYFFPLYTFIIIVIYFCIGFFVDLSLYHKLFLFLVGFSLSFHIALTIYALKQRQPDVTKTGVFFSLVFILLITPWMWVLIIKAVFPAQILLPSFAKGSYLYSRDAYVAIGHQSQYLWNKFFSSK
jgi:hypothetical protein